MEVLKKSAHNDYFSARGFTLAVFLKETSSSDRHEWVGGIIVLLIAFTFNIGTFRICHQDWIRSVVFGLSSTLIPAGYNNDPYFYQVSASISISVQAEFFFFTAPTFLDPFDPRIHMPGHFPPWDVVFSYPKGPLAPAPGPLH